ncbi:hypothetical protein AAG906_030000 [Vitis piasezkii]
MEEDEEQGNSKEKEKPLDDHIDTKVYEDKVNIGHEENGTCEGLKTMEISPSSTCLPCEIPSCDVKVLEGLTSEVFACAWSPAGSFLASGSGDSTARIWSITNGPCSTMQNGLLNIVLNHFRGRTNEKNKDVTTLDWNGDGTLLATGSYDNQARIWSRVGMLRSTLNKHKGPVFSLKWNKKGDNLPSGSMDKTAIVWAPTLDVDCLMLLCNLILDVFGVMLQDEVNAVKWDPTVSFLASCSDDYTAKQDDHLHDLKEHTKEIYTIRWSPTGAGTNNPNHQLVLASASFDSSIKLWDVELGCLLYSLNGHRNIIYTIEFSPNGEYLASGSLDNWLYVWSVKEGRLIKSYYGGGGVTDISWNKSSDKIAVSFVNKLVCVLDLKM